MQRIESNMKENELIKSYFSNLSENQINKYKALIKLYKEWNEKINVISRKDMDEFYVRHVLHSLAIAKVIQFTDNVKVMDVGTGGGFPGIPLAIMFPEVNFTLVDSIGKKIKVVDEIANELNLKNVVAINNRVEQVEGNFHFIVTRAVARIHKINNWVKGKIIKTNVHPEFKNGIFYLKGGDLTEEIKESKKKIVEYPIIDFFKEEFFETKKVLYQPF